MGLNINLKSKMAKLKGRALKAAIKYLGTNQVLSAIIENTIVFGGSREHLEKQVRRYDPAKAEKIMQFYDTHRAI